MGVARLTSSILFVVIFLFSGIAIVSAQSQRTLYVTIESESKGFIHGVPRESFFVSEKGQKIDIREMTSGPESMSIGFLFDVSGSMLQLGRKNLSEAASSIYSIVKDRKEEAEYFLVGFNKTVEFLADWTADAEIIGRGLRQLGALQSRKNNNTTSLNRAFLDALAKVQNGKFKKRALILFSDGSDTSDSSFRDVLRAVQASDVLIYFVRVTEPTPLIYTVGPHQSTEFVDLTTSSSGGRAFDVPSTLPENRSRVFVSNADARMRRAFENVFAELDAQYALRFRPSETFAQDEVRQIDVKLSVPSDLRRGAGRISIRFRKKYRE